MIPPKQYFREQLQKAFGLTELQADAIACAVWDMQTYHPDSILESAIQTVNDKEL